MYLQHKDYKIWGCLQKRVHDNELNLKQRLVEVPPDFG